MHADPPAAAAPVAAFFFAPLQMLFGIVIGLFGLMHLIAGVSIALDSRRLSLERQKIRSPAFGFREAGPGVWTWRFSLVRRLHHTNMVLGSCSAAHHDPKRRVWLLKSFPSSPLQDPVGELDRVQGPLVQFASLLGVPVIRLRAAIPPELISGRVEEAVGRKDGFSTAGFRSTAVTWRVVLERLYGKRGGAAVNPQQPFAGGQSGQKGSFGKEGESPSAQQQASPWGQQAPGASSFKGSKRAASPRKHHGGGGSKRGQEPSFRRDFGPPVKATSARAGGGGSLALAIDPSAVGARDNTEAPKSLATRSAGGRSLGSVQQSAPAGSLSSLRGASGNAQSKRGSRLASGKAGPVTEGVEGGESLGSCSTSLQALAAGPNNAGGSRRAWKNLSQSERYSRPAGSIRNLSMDVKAGGLGPKAPRRALSDQLLPNSPNAAGGGEAEYGTAGGDSPNASRGALGGGSPPASRRGGSSRGALLGGLGGGSTRKGGSRKGGSKGSFGALMSLTGGASTRPPGAPGRKQGSTMRLHGSTGSLPHSKIYEDIEETAVGARPLR